MHRTLLIAVLALALTGCGKHYWNRDGSTYEQFAADHRACVIQGGVAVEGQPNQVVVAEPTFRACMQARGWWRRHWQPVTSSDTRPVDWFRGIERFPPWPISVAAMPVAGLPEYLRCREVYGDPFQTICADVEMLRRPASPTDQGSR